MSSPPPEGESGLALTDLGVAEVVSSALPPEHVERLVAALELPAAPQAGDPLPLLWHWAFFTPTVATSDLGTDGHARLAESGPTAGLPRRMFAGARVRQLEPLLVGRPAQRHARVIGCAPKTGRSGRLLVVTVRYEVHQDGRAVLEEEQSLVYREAGGRLPLPAGDHRAQAPVGGWSEEKRVDRLTLFRFSALTFNAHRIHYDDDYVRRVEGYPRLVVHGPLIALLLAESARTHTGRDLASFEFRATAPLFEGLPFSVVGELDGATVGLTAVRNDGDTAMRATATLSDAG